MFLGEGGAMGQAFAELDVCKTHKGAKVEPMEIWNKGRIKEVELWSLSRAKQPLFDSSPQWLFMKELD